MSKLPSLPVRLHFGASKTWSDPTDPPHTRHTASYKTLVAFPYCNISHLMTQIVQDAGVALGRAVGRQVLYTTHQDMQALSLQSTRIHCRFLLRTLQ